MLYTIYIYTHITNIQKRTLRPQPFFLTGLTERVKRLVLLPTTATPSSTEVTAAVSAECFACISFSSYDLSCHPSSQFLPFSSYMSTLTYLSTPIHLYLSIYMYIHLPLQASSSKVASLLLNPSAEDRYYIYMIYDYVHIYMIMRRISIL